MVIEREFHVISSAAREVPIAIHPAPRFRRTAVRTFNFITWAGFVGYMMHSIVYMNLSTRRYLAQWKTDGTPEGKMIVHNDTYNSRDTQKTTNGDKQ